tara:strand:- start:683 stop:1090 length:408 start_codon:yes stop_codon:yes gene_type:complete
MKNKKIVFDDDGFPFYVDKKMKNEITGDDHPTYEESVEQSLKEKAISDSIQRNEKILKKLTDKPLDRFDLEDRIMGSSQIIDDLENLLYLVGDRPEPATEDEIIKSIVGMIEQSHIRHDRLFNTFASLVEQGTIK